MGDSVERFRLLIEVEHPDIGYICHIVVPMMDRLQSLLVPDAHVHVRIERIVEDEKYEVSAVRKRTKV